MKLAWLGLFALACAPAAPAEPLSPAGAECPEGPVERLTVVVGATGQRDGLEVTYRGMTVDHHDDGSFAMLTDLELRAGGDRTGWLPDARDEAWRRPLRRCVRLVEATQDQVTIELSR